MLNVEMPLSNQKDSDISTVPINRLILVGNGFDLAHGMKTRYSDFIIWYFSKCWEDAKKSYTINYEFPHENIFSNALLTFSSNRELGPQYQYQTWKISEISQIRELIK